MAAQEQQRWGFRSGSGVLNSEPVFGIRSKDGLKVLDQNPFIEGMQIPLAEGEELFCYLSAFELAEATKLRGRQHSRSLRNIANSIRLAIFGILLIILSGYLIGWW